MVGEKRLKSFIEELEAEIEEAEKHVQRLEQLRNRMAVTYEKRRKKKRCLK